LKKSINEEVQEESCTELNQLNTSVLKKEKMQRYINIVKLSNPTINLRRTTTLILPKESVHQTPPINNKTPNKNQFMDITYHISTCQSCIHGNETCRWKLVKHFSEKRNRMLKDLTLPFYVLSMKKYIFGKNRI
jgi:hypothetical protein